MPTTQLILVVSGVLILSLGIGISSLAAVCVAFYLGAASASGRLARKVLPPHYANTTPNMVDHGQALRDRVALEKSLVNPSFMRDDYIVGKWDALQREVTSGRTNGRGNPDPQKRSQDQGAVR